MIGHDSAKLSESWVHSVETPPSDLMRKMHFSLLTVTTQHKWPIHVSVSVSGFTSAIFSNNAFLVFPPKTCRILINLFVRAPCVFCPVSESPSSCPLWCWRSKRLLRICHHTSARQPLTPSPNSTGMTSYHRNSNGVFLFQHLLGDNWNGCSDDSKSNSIRFMPHNIHHTIITSNMKEVLGFGHCCLV